MRNHSGKARPAKRWQTCTSRSHLWPVPCLQESPTVPGTLGAVETAPSCPFLPIEGQSASSPYRDIESIELLDDPEYERIDNIEDVREGDVYVGTDGNRYTVLQRTTSNLQPLTVAVINTTFYPHRSYFGYALRPTPKLPDHDGLWLDRVGNTWTMCDGKVHIIRISDGDWCFTRPWFYTDSVQVVNAGPFRPAKAVEA